MLRSSSRRRAEKVWLMTYLMLFARHACLVYDVIDTGCWAQEDSTHGPVFAISENRLLTKRTRNPVKTAVFVLFKKKKKSMAIDGVCGASSVPPPPLNFLSFGFSGEPEKARALIHSYVQNKECRTISVSRYSFFIQSLWLVLFTPTFWWMLLREKLATVLFHAGLILSELLQQVQRLRSYL